MERLGHPGNNRSRFVNNLNLEHRFNHLPGIRRPLDLCDLIVRDLECRRNRAAPRPEKADR
jgi:hypothetical protein